MSILSSGLDGKYKGPKLGLVVIDLCKGRWVIFCSSLRFILGHNYVLVSFYVAKMNYGYSRILTEWCKHIGK